MLKGISKIIPPELLKILAEMGHGDELVIADGNYPSGDLGKRIVRMDGHNVPEILDAVLSLISLDTYVEYPVTLMEVVKGDTVKPTIWEEYKKIIKKYQDVRITFNERFEFYEHSKRAYVILQSSEKALYANIILKKGVL